MPDIAPLSPVLTQGLAQPMHIFQCVPNAASNARPATTSTNDGSVHNSGSSKSHHSIVLNALAAHRNIAAVQNMASGRVQSFSFGAGRVPSVSRLKSQVSEGLHGLRTRSDRLLTLLPSTAEAAGAGDDRSIPLLPIPPAQSPRLVGTLRRSTEMRVPIKTRRSVHYILSTTDDIPVATDGRDMDGDRSHLLSRLQTSDSTNLLP